MNETVCRAEAPRGDNDTSEWYVRGAKALLEAMQQRLAYLERSAASGAAPAMAVEARMLEERFASTRHRLTTFIQQHLGRSEKARELAEEFHDFAALVALLLSDKDVARRELDNCIRKYGRDFAFELFDHFVRTGKRHQLFDSPPFACLDAYLEVPRDELADVAWLHDLRLMGVGRLADPAMGALRLVHAAISAGSLPGRQVRVTP